jgi:hypothetical protein
VYKQIFASVLIASVIHAGIVGVVFFYEYYTMIVNNLTFHVLLSDLYLDFIAPVLVLYLSPAVWFGWKFHQTSVWIPKFLRDKENEKPSAG